MVTTRTAAAALLTLLCSGSIPATARAPTPVESGAAAVAAVGMLLGRITGEERFGLLCTGTLIGARRFLTAAHCFEHSTDPASFRVFLAREGLLAIRAIERYCDATPACPSPAVDLALVELAHPAETTEPMTAVRDLDAEAMRVSLIGYGRRVATFDDAGIRHLKRLEVRPCSDEPRQLCQDIDGLEAGAISACPGDSGGPLLDSSGALIGVVGTSGYGCRGGMSRHQRLAPYREWLERADDDDSSTRRVLHAQYIVGEFGPEACEHQSYEFDVPAGTDVLIVTMSHQVTEACGGCSSRNRLRLSIDRPSAAHPGCAVDPAPAQAVGWRCRHPPRGTWTFTLRREHGAGRFQLAALAAGPRSDTASAEPWRPPGSRPAWTLIYTRRSLEHRIACSGVGAPEGERHVADGKSPEQLEKQVSADLVERISRGERAAEAAMVDRYGRGLQSLLRRKTANPPLAEDLYQETFRVAIERLRSRGIDKPEQLAGFLHGVASNLVIAHYRKERRHATTTDDAKIARLPDPGQNQDAQLAREQIRHIVRALLGELKVPRDRELLIRYYVEDEDKQRICDALDLDNLHFNRVLFRAKRRFRELLVAAQQDADQRVFSSTMSALSDEVR